MRIRFATAAGLLLGVVIAGEATTSARAAPPWPPRGEGEQPKPKTESIKITGTIQGIRGDVMHVVNAERKQWLVKMPAEPRNVRLVGSAAASVLQPGMMLRFSGLFDSRGTPKGTIARLEIFTPRPTPTGEPPEQVGVFKEDDFVADDLFDGALGGQGATAQSEVASYVVVGQLQRLRRGEMTVAAGRMRVKAELDEQPEISIDLADYRWARPGDEIELDGWYYPQMTTHVVATRVTIRAAKTLGLVEEDKPPVKPVPAAPVPKPESE